MMHVRHAHERGHTQSPWVDSRHCFTYGNYYAPQHSRFSNLRVINRDIVYPDAGYETRTRENTEIITYVLKGTLDHTDSLGNKYRVKPGDVQWMTCGTGIEYSENNGSSTDAVHAVQIWFIPEQKGTTPYSMHHHFSLADRINRFQAFITPDGRGDSIPGGHDGHLYATLLEPGFSLRYFIPPKRRIYIYVVTGMTRIGSVVLHQGDSMILENERALFLEGIEMGEIFLFDLP